MTTNKESIKILITHNGSFHTDDVFAAATLSILLEKRGETFKIIRTRDEEIIKNGDYVFDIGGVYDAESNRFDHHQIGGAGKHANGIEYASFGLVWKKFGEKVCESKEVADYLEQKLVLPIDANDNGIDLCKYNFKDVILYTINDVLLTFVPTSLEDLDKDKQFFQALEWAKEILKREIKKIEDQIKITKIIENFYRNSADKRLIVINEPEVGRREILDALKDFSEPLFVVYKNEENWSVVVMRAEKNNYKNRKNLPKTWAGLRGTELQKVTGVPDAVFCHRALFLAVAKSKEGAIKLAKIALES